MPTVISTGFWFPQVAPCAPAKQPLRLALIQERIHHYLGPIPLIYLVRHPLRRVNPTGGTGRAASRTAGRLISCCTHLA